MINYPLSTDERIALMTSIFSDRNETDVAGHLPGSHAQTFVDMIDQVNSHTISCSNTEDKVTDLD